MFCCQSHWYHKRVFGAEHFPLFLQEVIILLSDADVFANYRPISDLSFLSEALERIVVFQIEGYLTTNGLFAKVQSAYRKQHRTETSLLRVVNDIRQVIGNKCETVQVLLDLSAAFSWHNRPRYPSRWASVSLWFLRNGSTLYGIIP